MNKRILEKYVYSDGHVLTVFGRLNTHARARTTTNSGRTSSCNARLILIRMEYKIFTPLRRACTTPASLSRSVLPSLVSRGFVVYTRRAPSSTGRSKLNRHASSNERADGRLG